MMTRDKILAYVRHTPFQPFAIHLSDGRNILAEHPDCMFVSKSGMLFHESDEGEFTIFELEHVTSINVKPVRRRKAA